jgi:hypothetical protein
MCIPELTDRLAASGRAWVDRREHALVVLENDGVAVFRSDRADRLTLCRFKRAVETLTRTQLPAGILGLRFLLAVLVAERAGLPH